jgi:hypothetical protein
MFECGYSIGGNVYGAKEWRSCGVIPYPTEKAKAEISNFKFPDYPPAIL